MDIKEKRFIRNHGIRRRLRVAFTILIVIPIVILGVYVYVIAKRNLISQTRLTMDGNAEIVASSLENNVKKANDVVKFISYEEAFRKSLQRADVYEYGVTEQLNAAIEPLIWYYLGSDNTIDDIHIYSDQIHMDHLGGFLSKPQTDQELAWYRLCTDEYSTNWVIGEDGEIYVLKALLDTSTSSQVVGIVTLKINKANFFSSINQSAYLDNGMVIFNPEGSIVTMKPIEDEALNDKILYEIRDGILENGKTSVQTKKYFIVKTSPLTNSWDIYYYVNRAKLNSEVLSILISDLILAFIVFILAFIATSKIADNFSDRIIAINKMADDVKNGHFDIVSNDTGNDEITRVSEEMVSMSRQLGAMVAEINRRNEEDMLLKENDIHYREWLFDFVVEKNNDILAVVNAGGFATSFITANAENVLGVPLSELKADIRTIEKAQRTDYEGERLSEAIEKSFKDGEEIVIDEIRFENLNTGERLYYRGVVVCTIDDGGRRMAVALYDRTQEFKRNHQLQEALSAAETANKAKTSFLANMSHDFRTPMNAITGFNLLIDKHSEEPEKIREYTHKISLASQNLLALLNDVLDMSKIESGKTTLDIKEMAMGLLLEEINSVISFQAKEKNQEYIVNVEGLEHDMFMGDKQRINEILVNILGNAVKYTPEGGKIEFTIKESPSSSEGFNNVTFTITDNGIGMKPEYKDKIFDAFTREEKGATKKIQGTGLGMAITKSLVELMGGTIRVESEEGKGSTFVVNLRLKVVYSMDVDFWTAHGISRILIVDDDDERRDMMTSQLDTGGLDIVEAPTGYGALHLIDVYDADKKPIDVILVNEVVQNMKAAEIISHMRGKDKRNNCLIIVLADDYSQIEDEVRAAGANDMMQKPFFLSTFKQLVDDIISRTQIKDTDEVKNPLEGMKFLAAEDNDINADILIELMNMEGATVTRGCNGQEAVELFKAAKEGDYDMILMDIQMPVMNGYEAAAAIRALGTEWSQKIPIIAMTANAYADDVQQSFDAGMNAHVSKPIDIKVVEKTILEFKNIL
ncbi:response regulator [Butyrivibrio proteoclasticus]|uniref:response regulator n=1 Tax=Butyrivibrio proteoclasticus TaxID=43305 RepID=UPI000684CC3C|nr:response regulator [Butyrivibrio proteoclasticus]